MPRTRRKLLTREEACEAALTHLADLKRIKRGWTVLPNPEPVYVAHASDAKGLSIPKDARPSSWQFAADDGSGPNILCEVNNGPLNEIISVRYGDSTAQSLRVRKDARIRQDVLKGDFHLRVLRIPELILQGFWLRSNIDQEDLFIPLGPAFGGYPAQDAVRLKLFLEQRFKAVEKKKDD